MSALAPRMCVQHHIVVYLSVLPSLLSTVRAVVFQFHPFLHQIDLLKVAFLLNECLTLHLACEQANANYISLQIINTEIWYHLWTCWQAKKCQKGIKSLQVFGDLPDGSRMTSILRKVDGSLMQMERFTQR